MENASQKGNYWGHCSQWWVSWTLKTIVATNQYSQLWKEPFLELPIRKPQKLLSTTIANNLPVRWKKSWVSKRMICLWEEQVGRCHGLILLMMMAAVTRPLSQKALAYLHSLNAVSRTYLINTMHAKLPTCIPWYSIGERNPMKHQLTVNTRRLRSKKVGMPCSRI